MTHAPVVDIDGVTKTFRPPPAPWRRLLGLPAQPDVVALRDVSLQIEPGEILGLVGPNGAGKTVLVKLIATLTEPTSGQLRVFGLDSVRDSRRIRGLIGLTTTDERSFYWRLTCRQNLMFFARLYGHHGAAARRLVDELLDTIDLSHAVDRPYRVLSAGNRQRLAIARALLPDPPLLLLDEPTSSLDPIAASNLRKLIVERLHGNRERSVLFTSHDLVEVEEMCTRVAVLARGRILACTDVPSLRRRHGSPEAVAITARQPIPTEALQSLAEKIVDLSWREADGNCFEITFPRESDDDLLDTVLTHLVRAGATILDCKTRAPNLKEAFDRLLSEEEEEDGDA